MYCVVCKLNISMRALRPNYGTFAPRNFRSLERKFHPWNFRSRGRKFPGTFTAGNESSRELSPLHLHRQFLSRVSILTSNIDIANLSVRPSVCPSVTQPAQSPDTFRQAGPIPAGSYPVQGKEATFVMVQSVLVSEERLFRYQRQTYRTVQGRLQEYWPTTRPEN